MLAKLMGCPPVLVKVTVCAAKDTNAFVSESDRGW